jgi:hypothetical protein
MPSGMPIITKIISELTALPYINRVFFNQKPLATTQNLWHTLLYDFYPRFIGRENEARGRASEASAELFDFFPKSGLALPSREGTSSS